MKPVTAGYFLVLVLFFMVCVLFAEKVFLDKWIYCKFVSSAPTATTNGSHYKREKAWAAIQMAAPHKSFKIESNNRMQIWNASA